MAAGLPVFPQASTSVLYQWSRCDGYIALIWKLVLLDAEPHTSVDICYVGYCRAPLGTIEGCIVGNELKSFIGYFNAVFD